MKRSHDHPSRAAFQPPSSRLQPYRFGRASAFAQSGMCRAGSTLRCRRSAIRLIRANPPRRYAVWSSTPASSKCLLTSVQIRPNRGRFRFGYFPGSARSSDVGFRRAGVVAKSFDGTIIVSTGPAALPARWHRHSLLREQPFSGVVIVHKEHVPDTHPLSVCGRRTRQRQTR